MKIDLKTSRKFEDRHIGPDEKSIGEMLQTVDAPSIKQLIEETIPESIRLKEELNIQAISNEYDYVHSLKKIAGMNKVFKSYIGLGYYNCITPSVIQRNVLENPGWYTAYTPYQAEIAQGRMEALINFQTVVTDLTGMELANASLLDEGTAAAEAMTMLYALRSREKKESHVFFVDEQIFPQSLAILETRAEPLGIVIKTGDFSRISVNDKDIFGMLIQYPGADGQVKDIQPVIEAAKENQISVAVAADLLSLTLLKPPGEMGADVVVGSSQRFGIPMGFGGPHAAFFATKYDNRRLIPGRIIGISKDKYGRNAYRMALQTREQHIKRERATSNICTAQVLLAVMAGMYAVYHGSEGLREISGKIHGLTQVLDRGIQMLDLKQLNAHFFDTVSIQLTEEEIESVGKEAESRAINFRYEGDKIFITLDETTSLGSVTEILDVFSKALNKPSIHIESLTDNLELKVPESVIRTMDYMKHEVFHLYHKEHEMLRYLKRLESKDLSMVHSMIPLGSCTMKLNATTEMLALSMSEFANMHPFAPTNQTKGYQLIIDQLEEWLSHITGMAATSLQPNSGAQGEYAGLMVIRKYLESTGQSNRNVTLIPASAHGTNPASAAMAGMKIVIVKCDENGNVDVEDLFIKAEANKENLAALMITYPSTHGIFEEDIQKICQIIHDFGGQVYMDGANMNAQVGLTSPAMIGADVCHLNLHKTFCIPHGGGGPGMGPICVAAHLKPYLPGKYDDGNESIAISAAPWGSASILTISYAYIAMMGGIGLKRATEIAILNANYMKARLQKYYPILFVGKKGRIGHEMIVDCREFKKKGIEVEDIAKRLMDYGYHAPTVSFPVPGTLMIEPTESENKEEIDRFVDAMISIRKEVDEIFEGKYDEVNNVLKNAPHAQDVLTIGETWAFPYTIEKAIYPLPYVRNAKFWPSVSRIDNAYGDRNLMCSCIPLDEYEEVSESQIKEIAVN